LKSATIAPRNLAIKFDLAFLVRLQKFALDIREHFHKEEKDWGGRMKPPDINGYVVALSGATEAGGGRKKIYFGGLTILPCNIKLSVAPARALTSAQASLEGAETAAIHQAVRKGDVRLDRKSAGILGVKIGSKNKTPLAVVRGLFKSFIVDGLLRLDGASLNFAGVSLRNYTSTGSQLTTALTAHYLASLRQNLPSVLGSLAAFGNPLGLVRGTAIIVLGLVLLFLLVNVLRCFRYLDSRTRRGCRVRLTSLGPSCDPDIPFSQYFVFLLEILCWNLLKVFNVAFKKWMHLTLSMVLLEEHCR
jgi:Vacuolar-sorting-associated 13 protein C-terminal